jgi:hypothetical protein
MRNRVPLFALLLVAATPALAVELRLTAPADYQVVQRITPGTGVVRIAGELSEPAPAEATVEARVLDGRSEPVWRAIGVVADRKVSGALTVPAGGWWTLDVRVVHDRVELARSTVEHVGVGDVFVVAGQSNSANHNAERQSSRTRRVAAFDGTAWRLADDPQPGASGSGGSFMPPLGDALVERLGVPVGFIPCGIGATSVREWLPKGTTFPAPPTIESRVTRTAAGGWASNGEAYGQFVARMKSVGPRGFRAVLWHQGESDANQKDPSRTLTGELYSRSLTQLIRDSRRDLGWEAPWFVAQASYHGPDDRGSDDIRAAQASLWKNGVALEGPDTDALGPEFREQEGRGVHFSGAGLRAHAAAWAEKIAPWLAAQFTAPRKRDGGTEWSRFEQLPECHAIGWVRRNVASSGTGRWDGVLDEAKWGTPSPQQAVERTWAWNISDDMWRAAVEKQGEGPREEVAFDLWVPDGVDVLRGIVVMSGHGSGSPLFKRQDLRALARELRLALFVFNGNPMQRGFWPRSLLFEQLKAFGVVSGHPELAHAPLFLYGHSNGTGFSAVFAAGEPERVWGWVSMRPGITFQVYQPGAARVPGLVIFGENDHFLARPSREENLAVVPAMRKHHDAVWNVAVEPDTGHGPGEKTWPLVFSFLRHTFSARVPADADPQQGPVKLITLAVDRGFLGQNWDAAKGGHQTLLVAPFAEFTGDKSAASWLVNAAYAADWQAFQRDGEIAEPAGSAAAAR